MDVIIKLFPILAVLYLARAIRKINRQVLKTPDQLAADVRRRVLRRQITARRTPRLCAKHSTRLQTGSMAILDSKKCEECNKPPRTV